MTLPLFEETYSVAQLCGEVRDLLNEAYRSLWVAGEVQRVRRSRPGHVYFELTEKGERDEIVGKLEAVCWRTDWQRVEKALATAGVELAEGQRIRCRANLDFYAPFGRLQLVVREVDPVFTLGELARRRQETLRLLAGAGLLDLNRGIALAPVPLRVALVTSHGSAAYHDFMATLEESGYAFQVRVLHAAVQGRGAERELASALAGAARLPVDCIALVRGGGAKTDLAAFDSRPVAEAVARSPVPVLTGLGHQIDESIADRVAHTSLKTPTKVAELLVERVREAERATIECARRLRRGALAPLTRAGAELRRTERALRLAGFRLAAARDRALHLASRLGAASTRRLRTAALRWGELRRRLAASAPRQLERRAAAPGRAAERLVVAARARLRRASEALAARARLCAGLSVDRTLARGFTMTRDAGGAILKSAAGLEEGARITTEWHDGRRTSRVEGS